MEHTEKAVAELRRSSSALRHAPDWIVRRIAERRVADEAAAQAAANRRNPHPDPWADDLRARIARLTRRGAA